MAPPITTPLPVSAPPAVPVTFADLLALQANLLDALAEGLGILEAKFDALDAKLDALVASAAEASAMAQSVMTGGLTSLLRGQKS